MGHVYPGERRVRSVAFKFKDKPDHEISVDLARLTTREESIARARKPGCGLGEMKAAFPRSKGFAVEHRPVAASETHPANYSHSQIEGQNTKEMCRILAENTVVIVEPDPQF